MPEETLYRNIASATTGYVTAPAGCGKTEAIIQTVKTFCTGKQLILTHTHAGVSALKKRFQENEVPKDKYHIETISGWALGWVLSYPTLSQYSGNLPIPQNQDWVLLYQAASNLLDREFAQWVIKNSYAGVLIDEYQDCTLQMHGLILRLKRILPCRIFGDPLQGIFSLNPDDPLVDWEQAKRDFVANLGNLTTPYRWIKAENQPLGDWLIGSRRVFEQNSLPNFRESSITLESIEPSRKAARLQALSRELNGSVCIIGSKHGKWHSAMLSALVNAGFIPVEPNDLPDLNIFLQTLTRAGTVNEKAEAAFEFLSSAFASFGTHATFIKNIISGTIVRRPNDEKRLQLHQRYNNGYSHSLLLDIIDYIFSAKIKCKKPDSIRCLKRVLEKHLLQGDEIPKIFSGEIILRKILGKTRPKRCVGSTLLLKGLEFDHVIILYNATDNGWSNVKDMYVAITRGCKSVRIIS